MRFTIHDDLRYLNIILKIDILMYNNTFYFDTASFHLYEWTFYGTEEKLNAFQVFRVFLKDLAQQKLNPT